MKKFFLLKKKKDTTSKKSKRPLPGKSSPAILTPPKETIHSQVQSSPPTEIEDINSMLAPDALQDIDLMLAPDVLPELVRSGSSDLFDNINIPAEVTVVCALEDENQVETNKEINEVSQVEALEYLHQLQDTQRLVDQLTMGLSRSRSQAAELLKHNSLLLEELKAVAGKDEATLEEHQMIRQEMMVLKGCLFLGALFIGCGGRADVIGILAFVWLVADAFVY